MSAQEVQVLTPQDFTSLDDLAFTGNEVTIENKRALIVAYRERGTITHAAETVGVSRRCVHHYINTDPVFADAIADAHEDCGDALESSVYERAFKSDLLAMFYLKAHRPKFRDKMTIDFEQVDNEIRERMRATAIDVTAQIPQITSQTDNEQKSE